jgi:hypothetical protein
MGHSSVKFILRTEDHRNLEIPPDTHAIAHALRDADRSNTCMLKYLDKWGDTIFNRHQCAQLKRELADFTDLGVDLTSLHDAIDRCIDGNHLYLWFIGD